jgi:hypothetical protein
MDEREEWRQIESIFNGALERDPSDRAEYIKRECAENDDLRRRVESLLNSDDRPSLIDKSLLARAPEQIPHQQSVVGTFVFHYRIDAELGRGGIGVVFRAYDTHLQRPVALKMLTEEPLYRFSARLLPNIQSGLNRFLSAA